jgi:hypothetical protein
MSSHAFLKGGKMHGLQEVFYADDKQDGEFLTLAEDGKVLARKVWLDGEADGWSFESHDNGQRHGLLQVWASGANRCGRRLGMPERQCLPGYRQ